MRIDLPVCNPILTARGSQMSHACAVFDAGEQESLTIGQSNRAGIEDRVNLIGPVRRSKNRILFRPQKQVTKARVRLVVSEQDFLRARFELF